MTNERTQTAARDTITCSSHEGTRPHTPQVANAPAQGAQAAASSAPSAPQSENTQLPCLLCAEHLGIKHLSGKAFWDVSLRVYPHQILALSGEQGTGKTALLLSLAGVMRTTHGSIHIMDLPMQQYRSMLRCYTGITLVRGLNDFYHTQTIKEALDCELGIAQKLYRRRLHHEQLLAQRPQTMQVPDEFLGSKNEFPSFESARELLETWGVTAPLSQAIGSLTIDEQLRVSIALALLKKPLLLFIDDIENGLTGAQTEQLLRDIRAYVNTHTCACVAEMLQHNLHRHADCVLNLSKADCISAANKEANGAPNRDDSVPAPNKTTKVRSLNKEAHNAR